MRFVAAGVVPACRQAGNGYYHRFPTHMYIVYALLSETSGYMYVGMTKDVDKRLKQHNAGHSTWTKRYKPWKIVYTESAPDRITARAREKILKHGAGKEFLKNIAGVV